MLPVLAVLEIVCLRPPDDGTDIDKADIPPAPISLTTAAIAPAFVAALEETLFRRVTR